MYLVRVFFSLSPDVEKQVESMLIRRSQRPQGSQSRQRRLRQAKIRKGASSGLDGSSGQHSRQGFLEQVLDGVGFEGSIHVCTCSPSAFTLVFQVKPRAFHGHGHDRLEAGC